MLKNCFLEGVTEVLAVLYLRKPIGLCPVRAQWIAVDNTQGSQW